MFDNVCREEIFMMNTVICLFTNDNMLLNIWRKYSDNWMVLWTSEPTLKISKNFFYFITLRIIFCTHEHWDQPPTPQNVIINV